MDWKEHFAMMNDMHVAHVNGQCWPKCGFCAAQTEMVIVTQEKRERMIREEFEVSDDGA